MTDEERIRGKLARYLEMTRSAQPYWLMATEILKQLGEPPYNQNCRAALLVCLAEAGLPVRAATMDTPTTWHIPKTRWPMAKKGAPK